MKFKTAFAAAFAVALSCVQALGQATILPPGETCFSATAGISGMLGLLGTFTGGSLYTNGTYGGVALTGGSGSGATATITVSGNAVTAVSVLNPGSQYLAGDVLSATAATIGGTGSGFTVPVSSTSINSSLAGGTVSFYVPNTQTFKQTWQDAGQAILNQNPVPLDQNGCALIYGAGIYRQILKDSLQNTVWDKPTASTAQVGIFWAGLAGGTGNAITIADSAFALQDGATIQFLAVAANTGPTTVVVSGGAAIAIVRDLSTGPSALTGGEIAAGNTTLVTYDATNVLFHIINPAVAASGGGSGSSIVPPQGYLNLVGQASGDVIQTGDVASANTIFYSPFVGTQVPIWNGSSFKSLTFSELTTTITATGSTAGTIQDACVFSNNGIPTLVIGPSWTSVAAGSGNRGTGAGTAQISRLQGIWVNAVSITAYNGLSSYSIPANQCTIVGSINVDTTPGLVSAYRSYGQSRKWGFWNFYNRQLITVVAGDPTATWSNVSAAVRAANGNANNSITVLSGLPEEPYYLTNTQLMGIAPNPASSLHQYVRNGIGYNSVTIFSGTQGQVGTNAISNGTIQNWVESTVTASFISPPAIGIQTVTALEQGNSAASVGVLFNGTQASMLLYASWRG